MKAQVTMFIIMGLFFLVSFGLLIYFFYFQSVSGPVDSVPGESFRRNAVGSVRYYVNNCLAETSAQALEFLGKQGGRLYKSQGGTFPDPVEFVLHDGFKVSYSILSPSGIAGVYSAFVPLYPWNGFPWIVQDGREIEWLYGYYGLPDFPPLYKSSRGSVQEALEKYIEANIQKCVDWSYFRGLSFDAGIPRVQMAIAKNITQLYSEEFISFALDWPVVITDAQGSRTELRDFVVNYPISFGRIYYNAKSLVDSDVSGVSFNPVNYAGYDISVVRDVNSVHDDIIVFTDRNSRVIGRPFSFWLARKNRAPALVLINQSVSENSYCLGTKFSIDGRVLRATAGQLAYSLKAYDPDEDSVQFILLPETPELSGNQMTFRVIAQDKEIEDYQDITVHGVACE
jgi:hypothetical protein